MKYTFEQKLSWSSPCLQEYEFWGLHPKDGRLSVDTKRYKKTCEKIGITDFMPAGLFAPRNTVYFLPAKSHRNDYRINIFRDLLNGLRSDWNEEYKPIFKKIRTPEQVEEASRTDALMYMSDSDDYDNIEVDAKMEGFKRIGKYNKVIQSLYCQFIQKLCTEVDRYTLIVMVACGYKGTDYSFDSFCSFSDGLLGEQKRTKLRDLEKFEAYNLLHKVNNFLKHNTVEAYKTMHHVFPHNVCNLEDGTAEGPYQNGMFAGDWLILKPGFIDSMFDKLLTFFEDYCRVYLKENAADADWNYDDYFKDAVDAMKNPAEYLGLPG
jgi:hypothetical protein